MLLSSILPRLALGEGGISSDVTKRHFMGDVAVMHPAQTGSTRGRYFIRRD